MKKILLVAFLVARSAFPGWTQCPECTGTGRYADSVFTCSSVTTNIQYGTGLRDWSWTHLFCLNIQLPPYQVQLPLLADFYEPCGDTVSCRPLVIFIHGGAWAAGNKADFAPYCDFLAKRGYAVASINYRLSLPGNALCWDADADSIRLIRAAARAVQDAKAAVRYFRANASEYRIDPENIFVVGGSAGGFTALGVGYADSEDERPGACGAQPQLGNWLGNLYFPDMGSIEGAGGNAGVSSAVRGVVNLSGGVFDPGWLDGPADPPLLSFHGTADDVVPFGHDCILQAARDADLYHHCIHVYGSGAVHDYADSLGLDARLFAFPGGGHGFTQTEISVILSETTAFLCQHLALPTATDEPAENSPVRVFPNPASGAFSVRIPARSGAWRLFNSQGALVRSFEIQEEITVVRRENLPAGIYFWQWKHERMAASGRLIAE